MTIPYGVYLILINISLNINLNLWMTILMEFYYIILVTSGQRWTGEAAAAGARDSQHLLHTQ